MAGKKQPSLNDAIKMFDSAMQRASLTDYYHVNQAIVSKTSKGKSVMVVVDPDLWYKLVERDEFKNKLKEVDVTNPDEFDQIELLKYSSMIDNDLWVNFNMEEVNAGKVIRLDISGLEYQIAINKDLIPIRLKKSECNNTAYAIFKSPTLAIGVKKYFDCEINGTKYGFTIVRIFRII